MSTRTKVIIAVSSILVIAAVIFSLMLIIRNSNATKVVYPNEGVMQVPIKSGG